MKSKTVLFVCVHNAGRSQMAEAFTNHMAKALGLPVLGLSAGTVSRKALNPLALQVMSEEGISMEGQTPKLLTDELVKQADQVISMGCGVDAETCPAKFILSDDWELEDPANQPIEKVRAIRDSIKSKVKILLSELDQ